MEPIYFTYPTPFELIVTLKHRIPKTSTLTIPKGSTYELDGIRYCTEVDITSTITSEIVNNSLTSYKYISTQDKTDMDFSLCTYKEILENIKNCCGVDRSQILHMTLTNYDPHDPSIKNIDIMHHYDNLINWNTIRNFNAVCVIDSKLYEQTHGLIMTNINYKAILERNKLNYVRKINSVLMIKDRNGYYYKPDFKFKHLKLPNLTHIVSQFRYNILGILNIFPQVHTLKLIEVDIDDDSHFDDVKKLLSNQESLSTLKLQTKLIKYHKKRILEIFDLFTSNTTLTKLSFDHTFYSKLSDSNDDIDKNVQDKIYNLIKYNTTLTCLELTTSIPYYDENIFDALWNNTILNKIELCNNSFYYPHGYVNCNRTKLIQYVESRHENLPELRIIFSNCDDDLQSIFINKYYYAQNLNILIDNMGKLSNEEHKKFRSNCVKYNELLSKKCLIQH